MRHLTKSQRRLLDTWATTHPDDLVLGIDILACTNFDIWPQLEAAHDYETLYSDTNRYLSDLAGRRMSDR